MQQGALAAARPVDADGLAAGGNRPDPRNCTSPAEAARAAPLADARRIAGGERLDGAGTPGCSEPAAIWCRRCWDGHWLEFPEAGEWASPRRGFRVDTTDYADRDALRAVRGGVRLREQGVPLELELDAGSGLLPRCPPDADGRPIGTGRRLAHTLGRMAVLPQWRRRGVGAAMLAAR